MPYCATNSFSDSSFPYFQDLSYNVYIAVLGHGCTNCTSSVKLQLNNGICSKNSQNPDTLTTPTLFIKNCLLFQASLLNGLKCAQCKPNFVISSNYDQCFPNSTLANCSMASDQSTCVTCSPGYVNISNQCQKITLTNCANID